ncbi:NADP-dependent oxidoreductase [Aquimarina addita]|uniref:NADP-dependent oxidoreductase n=1 Tax=Aquimarina addita TaxID=870485 RepID=A0ABP7XEB9_9FLAO
MSNQTKVILLNNRPEATPEHSDFKFIEETVPEIETDQVLLKSLFVSVDPYLRGRMRDIKSYIPPFELHQPITSAIVAEVIESKNDRYVKGDYVLGNLPWKTLLIADGASIQKVKKMDMPLSAYLGVLGMTGLTAYFGLEDIGKLKEGETLVVSGAAGAVGSIVGQIGKIKGCRVVGIAGTDDKINTLKKDFNFDEGINYKTTDDMRKALAQVCPDGIDVYWDNVGGAISDAVLFHINQFARIINCGAIADYNEKEMPTSMSPQTFLIKNSALMQGFIVSNYQKQFLEGIEQLATWLQQGKLTHKETIVEGFEHIPQAFIDLFNGTNTGKMVVKI